MTLAVESMRRVAPASFKVNFKSETGTAWFKLGVEMIPLMFVQDAIELNESSGNAPVQVLEDCISSTFIFPK